MFSLDFTTRYRSWVVSFDFKGKFDSPYLSFRVNLLLFPKKQNKKNILQDVCTHIFENVKVHSKMDLNHFNWMSRKIKKEMINKFIEFMSHFSMENIPFPLPFLLYLASFPEPQTQSQAPGPWKGKDKRGMELPTWTLWSMMVMGQRTWDRPVDV